MPTLNDGTVWEIRLRCEQTDDPLVTSIRLEPGWSPNGACVIASALNRRGELVSETVTKQYPPDCIALPEPPASSLALCGALVLVGLGRRRLRLP